MQKIYENRVSEKGIGILDFESRPKFSKVYSSSDISEKNKPVPAKFVLSVVYFISLSISLFLLFS